MKDDDYRDYDEGGDGRAIGVALLWTVIIFVALMAGVAVLLSSCTTTKYVPVETVRTEYKDKVREVHTTDSITDTRIVYVKGDTLIDYRDRVKWRDRFIHDTVSLISADTIREPYPVERKLSRWQKVKMDFGGLALGALVIVVCVVVVWLIKKLRIL